MMTNKKIKELNSLIHAMSNSELQAHIKKTKVITIKNEPPPEEPYSEWELKIHELSTAELKALFDKSSVKGVL